jgi:hypothetical protein
LASLQPQEFSVFAPDLTRLLIFGALWNMGREKASEPMSALPPESEHQGGRIRCPLCAITDQGAAQQKGGVTGLLSFIERGPADRCGALRDRLARLIQIKKLCSFAGHYFVGLLGA